MRDPRHVTIVVALVLVALTVTVAPGRAHKPITSPYTYTDDVFPILRDRCGRCHVPEGVAPMSLMTYEDTVPWGESIRVELLSGHMPPWSVDGSPARFRNAQPLSAREMNVLLTWATGGTPFGNPDKTPPPESNQRSWPLGTPDVELPLPTEFVLGASAQEETAEFVLPTRFGERRWLRAVDLLPGTPSIVRSATVQVQSAAPSDSTKRIAPDSLVALWLPGDDPVALEGGAAFEVPAGAELLVRVRYKKTWQYERKELRDRSSLGLYFAPNASDAVGALALTHDGPTLQSGTARKQMSDALTDDVRAVALYASDSPSNARVVVSAIAPDGSRRELIAFHPQRDWPRRYWFQEPIALARGTKFETAISLDDETPALSVNPGDARTQDLSTLRLTLNLVSAPK